MGFIKGFVIGSTAGFVIGTTISERQRRELVDRLTETARRRTRPVGDAVARNAGELADTVTTAAVDHIDDIGARTADSVDSAIGA